MRYALIENGHVTNIIIADPNYQSEKDQVIQTDNADIGWLYKDGAFIKPETPETAPIVPEIISRRQFFQMAAIDDFITQEEALQGMTGTLPQIMKDGIEKLPEEHRFPALALATGTQSFERSNPLSNIIGASIGLKDKEIDAFWIEAAKL